LVSDIKEGTQAERVLGIRAPRKVFGPKRQLGSGEDFHSEALHNLSSSTNMTLAIKRN
jgi:hypothetical protein